MITAEDAAKAYLSAADCYSRIKDDHEAATAYVNAGNVLKKDDPKTAAEHFRTAAQMFVTKGHFSVAAKSLQEAGELYEGENDTDNAVDCLQTAADYYESENSSSRANTCLIKIADMQAKAENYDRAIEIYEQVARGAVDNTLLKWSAKEHLFKAMICHFCKNDIVGAKRALDKYKDLDPMFSQQREAKLCEAIADAMEDLDVDSFTKAVGDYDSMTPLDPFKTTLLLRVKNNLSGDDGGGLV